MASLKQQLRMAEKQLDNNNINHILHLVLTLLTGGLWVIVWISVAMTKPSDASIIAKIDKLEDKIYEERKGIKND